MVLIELTIYYILTKHLRSPTDYQPILSGIRYTVLLPRHAILVVQHAGFHSCGRVWLK